MMKRQVRFVPDHPDRASWSTIAAQIAARGALIDPRAVGETVGDHDLAGGQRGSMVFSR